MFCKTPKQIFYNNKPALNDKVQVCYYRYIIALLFMTKPTLFSIDK